MHPIKRNSKNVNITAAEGFIFVAELDEKGRVRIANRILEILTSNLESQKSKNETTRSIELPFHVYKCVMRILGKNKPLIGDIEMDVPERKTNLIILDEKREVEISLAEGFMILTDLRSRQKEELALEIERRIGESLDQGKKGYGFSLNLKFPRLLYKKCTEK